MTAGARLGGWSLDGPVTTSRSGLDEGLVASAPPSVPTFPPPPAREATGWRPGTLGTGAPAAPRWLRAADECQRSLRRPQPVAVDLASAVSVTLGLSDSVRAAAIVAVATMAGGLLFGLWKRRSSVQAQGLSWCARRLIPVAALDAGALYAWGGLTARHAATAAVVVVAALTLLHGLLWVIVGCARRRGLGLSRTLIIGSETQVADVARRIALSPEAGLACVHSKLTDWRPDHPVRSQALLEAVLADHAIEHVVCTAGDGVARDVIRYAPLTVDVTVVHPLPLAGPAPARLGDAGVTCLARPAWGTDGCKRAFDLVTAAVLLSVLSPLLAVIALAVRLGDPGPAVFRQKRTGRGNRPFTIFKFRSMVEGAESQKAALMDRNVADGPLFKAEDDPRITTVGAFIRRFSIDELPQLWNVVRGEMSLVGPRPLPSEFDDSDIFARIRHQVLPGITGLWQVKGANALPYDDMIDLDCSYVASRSLGLDLRILLQTVPAVLVRRDPY